MDKRYEPLFQPWKIGNVEIKNRIVMLPMEGTNMIQWEAKTGFVKGIDAFYRDRKDNNIGLFIPGLIPLVSIVGEKWVYEHPEVFEPVKPIVREIHESGAKIFFQISAGSGRSMLLPPLLKPFVKKGFLKKASSRIIMSKWWWSAPDDDEPNVWDPNVKMDLFTSDMISRFVYAFGQTAKLCKEASVDGVEIHAVHEGYLLDQFAMPYTNHRDDCYGGSLENRLRFACEVVREIKKVCGEDYPVSLRYSVCSMTRGFNQGAVPGEEFTEVGRSMAESEQAIRILEEAGYDMFDCDNGTYDAWYWAHPPVYAPLNMNLPYVEHIRQFTSKPVVCAGRMQPEEAADSIAAGRIDAMGIGRQLLCDPEYVTKVMEGRQEDVRPCIACHGACLPFNGLNGKGTDIDPMHPDMGRCVLNPWTNNETRSSLAQALRPKKIAVVGGGLGGMETAIQAALRGHEVDLYEKTGRLGGAFIAASAMSFKEKDKQLLQWYERMLAKSGAKVHLNCEVTDLESLGADAVVVAVGATARTLPIPGGGTCRHGHRLLGIVPGVRRERGDHRRRPHRLRDCLRAGLEGQEACGGGGHGIHRGSPGHLHGELLHAEGAAAFPSGARAPVFHGGLHRRGHGGREDAGWHPGPAGGYRHPVGGLPARPAFRGEQGPEEAPREQEECVLRGRLRYGREPEDRGPAGIRDGAEDFLLICRVFCVVAGCRGAFSALRRLPAW